MHVILRPFWETIFGPRGVVKVNSALLPLAAALASAPEGGGPTPGAVFALMAAVVCWNQVCILANDRVDRADDRAAGKSRWITEWPPIGAGLLLGLLLAVGLWLSTATGGGAGAAVYAATAALGLAYSVPPAALKRRGVWGHVSYAGACALAFVGLPAVAFGIPPLPTALLAATVLLDKWVNLDFHQVVDYPADARVGAPTLAVKTGLARSRVRLRAEAYLATAALAAAAVMVLRMAGRAAGIPAAIGLAVFALAALHAVRQRRVRRAQRLMAELPPVYLAASLAVLRIIPLAMIGLWAWTQPAYRPLAVVAGALVALEMAQMVRYRYR